MKNNSSEILIPKAAIRTMEKDLGGIVFEEWEETLAESEINDLLKNLTKQEKPIVVPSDIELEEQKKMEQQKQAAIDLENKRREAEKRESEKIRLQKLAEQEKEKEIVSKIRRQAVEMEEIVKSKMKEEEEKYQEQEDVKRHAVQEGQQEETLKLKKKEIDDALLKLPELKKPLDETKSYLFKERDRIQQSIDPIAESERKIEENIKLVSKIEGGSAIPLEKRRAEKDRQMLELERNKVEENRWGYEKELFAVEEQLKELEIKYQDLASREAKLLQQQKEINEELSKIDKRRDRKQKEDLIDKLVEEKNILAKERDGVAVRRKELEEKLAEISTDEKKVEKEEEYLRHEEEVAKGPERQKIEMERQRLGGQRIELEKKRWRLEDEKRKVALEESRLNLKYKNLLEKENLLREQIDEINKDLGIVPKEQPKPISPKVGAASKEAMAQIKEREGEYVKRYGPTEEMQISQTGLEDEETKLAKEALKRLEEKREKEALLRKLDEQNKTREMKRDELIIERLKSGQAPSPFPGEEQVAPEGQGQQPSIIYQGEPTNKWIKIVIFGLIAAILLGLIVFAIMKIRKPEEEEETPPDVEIIIPTIPPYSTSSMATSTPMDLTIWNSLIPNIVNRDIYKIDRNKAIPSRLGLIYREQIAENQFTRIIFENTSLAKYVALDDFADGMSLSIPDQLTDAVDKQFTMYLYSSNGIKTFGWIAKRKLENNLNLSQIMTSWEKSLSTNAEDLGNIFGLKIKGKCNFKSQTYKTSSLRSCDLVSSPGCYGACYAITNNYLIYGTCCSTVTNLITILNQ
ncbi:MAG: hypothetical protein PHS27_00610 [Candidatus Pacebacteria bacterium]|nr:hypothetical protein [Candidatus Paceibacterota bacterium]